MKSVEWFYVVRICQAPVRKRFLWFWTVEVYEHRIENGAWFIGPLGSEDLALAVAKKHDEVWRGPDMDLELVKVLNHPLNQQFGTYLSYKEIKDPSRLLARLDEIETRKR